MGHAQSHQPFRGGLRTTNEAIQPNGYFCRDGELGACVTSGPYCVRCIFLNAPYKVRYFSRFGVVLGNSTFG